MTHKNRPDQTAKPPQAREGRLKAALKANLARRKAQNRARAKGQETGMSTSEAPGQDKDA